MINGFRRYWPQQRIAGASMGDLVLYGGLFLAAFSAATLLPAQSEALVAGLLLSGYAPWLVLAVASTGNVLGSVVNWLLGRGIQRFP